MRSLLTLATRARQGEEGVTALEYALIAALVAVAIIASVQALGGSISNTFNTVAAAL